MLPKTRSLSLPREACQQNKNQFIPLAGNSQRLSSEAYRPKKGQDTPRTDCLLLTNIDTCQKDGEPDRGRTRTRQDSPAPNQSLDTTILASQNSANNRSLSLPPSPYDNSSINVRRNSTINDIGRKLVVIALLPLFIGAAMLSCVVFAIACVPTALVVATCMPQQFGIFSKVVSKSFLVLMLTTIYPIEIFANNAPAEPSKQAIGPRP